MQATKKRTKQSLILPILLLILLQLLKHSPITHSQFSLSLIPLLLLLLLLLLLSLLSLGLRIFSHSDVSSILTHHSRVPVMHDSHSQMVQPCCKYQTRSFPDHSQCMDQHRSREESSRFQHHLARRQDSALLCLI